MPSDFLSHLLSSNVQIQVGLRVVVAAVELAFLAAVIGGVEFLLRGRIPRLIASLWALVLVKSLFTLVIGSPLLLARIEITPPPVPTELPLAGDRGEFRNVSASNEFILRDSEDWIVTVEDPLSEEKRQALFVWVFRESAFLKWAALIWVAGILLGALRWTLAGYALRCVIARGAEPDARLLETYEAEVARRGMAFAPRLCLSSEVESPVLFGAFKPTILLPVWLSEADRPMLRHVFAHELMHHSHRDAFVLALGQLAKLLLFFHPVAHWVFQRWLFNAELACDRALVRSESEARQYARELLEVMERMRHRRGALSGLYATRFQLTARMNALLKDPLTIRPILTGWEWAVILSFGLGVLLFGIRVDIKTLDFLDYDTLFYGSWEIRGPKAAPLPKLPSDDLTSFSN